MRNARSLLVLPVMLILLAMTTLAGETTTPFRDVDVRPLVAVYQLPLAVDGAFVTVSGVVFSRAPVDSVRVGERTATLRPAAPEDLVRFRRVPDGAADMTYRTYFEVPDAPLPELGAAELEVRAATTDGRYSDVHRLTIVRMPRTVPSE